MSVKKAGHAQVSVGQDRIQRYNRPTRWFHAGTYLAVLILLGTGWWVTLGREGQPSPLAQIFLTPDTTLHTNVGWILAGFSLLGLLLGRRAVRTFVTETLRVDRSDRRWLARWPLAVLTGRFARHEGHFDPGQRILNIALMFGLSVLILSGVGMAWLSGGPVFAVLVHLHKWSTYGVTPLIAGHIVIAAGILPGYRGVWRSMHMGGRLQADVARRLWPGWFERATRPAKDRGPRPPTIPPRQG
ncbi:MAG: cytochrome b/b6 domain-containing protein [Streptosporangiales bacterium]|nr:cytochrome b/b6 domain-containing protein [Streptosporangiales bacterium]